MQRIKFLTAAAAALLTLAASCGQNAQKQGVEQTTIQKQELTSADIPGEIPWQGDLIKGYRYEDNTGENIVITTESEIMDWIDPENPDEDGGSYKQMWAYRFQKQGNEWVEVWKFYEIETYCYNFPVADFVKDALSITDLDNNGTAEIWLMYLQSCPGDPSPIAMYLRMYDNLTIYTMEGTNRMPCPIWKEGGELEFEMQGGEYTFDNQFLNKNTNPAFVEFAKSLWEKNIEGR